MLKKQILFYISEFKKIITYFFEKQLPESLASAVYITVTWLFLLNLDDSTGQYLFVHIYVSWSYNAILGFLTSYVLVHLLFYPKFQESGLVIIMTYLSFLKPYFLLFKGFLLKHINFHYFLNFKIVIYLRKKFYNFFVF